MKSYTDLPQSKKLTEFLPLESADHFHIIGHLHTDGPRYEVIRPRNEVVETDKYWPCWSLAALLGVLPSASLESSDDHHYRVHCMKRYTDWYDSAVDACVEMIVKLKECEDSCAITRGEQTPLQTNESAWIHLVSDVLTWKDGIGQYLDGPRVRELAKKLRSEYARKL